MLIELELGLGFIWRLSATACVRNCIYIVLRAPGLEEGCWNRSYSSNAVVVQDRSPRAATFDRDSASRSCPRQTPIFCAPGGNGRCAGNDAGATPRCGGAAGLADLWGSTASHAVSAALWRRRWGRSLRGCLLASLPGQRVYGPHSGRRARSGVRRDLVQRGGRGFGPSSSMRGALRDHPRASAWASSCSAVRFGLERFLGRRPLRGAWHPAQLAAGNWSGCQTFCRRRFGCHQP